MLDQEDPGPVARAAGPRPGQVAAQCRGHLRVLKHRTFVQCVKLKEQGGYSSDLSRNLPETVAAAAAGRARRGTGRGTGGTGGTGGTAGTASTAGTGERPSAEGRWRRGRLSSSSGRTPAASPSLPATDQYSDNEIVIRNPTRVLVLSKCWLWPGWLVAYSATTHRVHHEVCVSGSRAGL